MKRRLPTGSAAALGPVQSALVAEARASADAVLAEAREEAERRREEARERAARILADSRAEGEQQARSAVAARMARRRREARALGLEAQRDLHDELRRRCRDAARALREDPDYPRLRERLTEHAMAVLGGDATVEESPDGGVVATAGSRRLDLSLPALADREVDRLGAEVMRLWAA